MSQVPSKTCSWRLIFVSSSIMRAMPRTCPELNKKPCDYAAPDHTTTSTFAAILPAGRRIRSHRVAAEKDAVGLSAKELSSLFSVAPLDPEREHHSLHACAVPNLPLGHTLAAHSCAQHIMRHMRAGDQHHVQSITRAGASHHNRLPSYVHCPHAHTPVLASSLSTPTTALHPVHPLPAPATPMLFHIPTH